MSSYHIAIGDTMADVFGIFDPQALVVLVVALIGVIPAVLYRNKVDDWFLYTYGFLFVAALATNLEYLLLPEMLNVMEHVVGNMGAGIAFAASAYLYRQRNIVGETGEVDLEV